MAKLLNNIKLQGYEDTIEMSLYENPDRLVLQIEKKRHIDDDDMTIEKYQIVYK